MNCSMKCARVLGILGGGMLGWWVLSSCETVESLDRTLQIEPASTNLTAAGETVVFRVVINVQSNMVIGGSSTNVAGPSGAPVIFPLEWSVSDPSLGRIRASGGLSAVYERNGRAMGNNYIHVTDRGRRYEGVAVVVQSPVP